MRRSALRPILERIERARTELDLAYQEIHGIPERTPEQGKIDDDIISIRARVGALEARVQAIEERGER